MIRSIFAICLFAFASSARGEVLLDVAPDGPVASLAAARDQVQALRAKGERGEIRVRFAPGVYRLAEPVMFTAADSGVTYEGAGAAVISGGRRITGWRQEAAGLWRADVPGVREGKAYFEQLWVNGRRAVRARTPNLQRSRSETPLPAYLNLWSQASKDAFPGMKDPAFEAFVMRPADFAIMKNIPAAELSDVLITVAHAWTVGQCRVAALNDAARAVRIKGRSRYPFIEFEPDQRCFIENYRAALDAEGEWFLARDGALFYQPRAGEDMTKAEVIAPVVEKLLVIKGEEGGGAKASGLRFKNLTFAHTQALYGPDGHHDGQAAAGIGAAIEIEDAAGVVFENCEIAHTGGYGIWFRDGCEDGSVLHCHLHDLGGGGMRIGTTKMPTETTLTRRITVDDCIIQSGGRMFPSACGVYLSHAADCAVTHCDIGDFYYTGISAGWVWGYSPSPSKRNRFDHNHIHHLGHGYLSDMGGFYGLGRAEGTTISHNHVHHVASYRYGGWGLYTDEGSTGVTMENNLVHDTSEGTFHQHYGKWNQVSNNIFAFGRKSQIQRTRPEKHASFAYERNIVVYETPVLLDGSWYNWEPGTMEMRNNVYWNIAGLPVKFHDTDLAGWQKKTGRDEGSIVADPLFVDAARRDFRLKPDSPALKLGFKPFDFSQAGVRGDAASAWRKQAARLSFPDWDKETQPWPMPEYELSEDFESMPLSFPTVPRQEIRWQNKGDSIFVSDEQAASGKRSLKITDAPGLDPSWEPLWVLKPNYKEGVARVSFNLRLAADANGYIEWRSAGHPYLTGPSLWFERGQMVERTSKTKFELPADAWVHLEVTASVGAQASGKWSLKLTLPGQPPREIKDLPCEKDWNEFGWLGFVSTATVKTAFYIDDIKITRS